MEPQYEIVEGQVIKIEQETVVRQTPMSIEELEAKIADADKQILALTEYKNSIQAELDIVKSLIQE